MATSHRYTFEYTGDPIISDDNSLTVQTMRAEWKHGIYGTHEEMHFTLLIGSGGTDTVIWSHGERDDLTLTGEFGEQLSRWIAEHV